MNMNDYNELQEDLNNLMRWSEEWQMLFNIDRCKVIHLGRANESSARTGYPGTRFNTRYPGTRQIPGYPGITQYPCYF